MESIVKSRLTGKWYLIAQTHNDKMMSYWEVFIYLSISCDKILDLLFVGINEDRSKVLRKLSLKILTTNEGVYLLVRNMFYRKKLKVLLFNEIDGVMIISDDKKKCLSIYSRKCRVRQEVVESCLSKIDFSKLNIDEVKLYSNCICSDVVM